MPNIAVIGAGVVGLSTAVCIQEKIPTAAVTIFADKFSPETTSNAAAGLFRPSYGALPDNDPFLLKNWADTSFKHYHGHVVFPDAPEKGIFMISGYLFYNSERGHELYRSAAYSHSLCTEKEHSIVPEHYKYGESISTLMVECQHYLPWLTRKFKLQGGRIVPRTISSLGEFVGKFDAVVNCTGLGSRALVGDTEITSKRGQMLSVKAPWIKNFIFTGTNSWIIPGLDGVYIGGTLQEDNYNLEVDPADREAIWERACSAVPSLKNVKIEHEWVGLRPYRSSVRLEIHVEEMKFGDHILQVVHNYGHASSGVSLSWGTAVHATQLVQQVLQDNMTSKL